MEPSVELLVFIGAIIGFLSGILLSAASFLCWLVFRVKNGRKLEYK